MSLFVFVTIIPPSANKYRKFVDDTNLTNNYSDAHASRSRKNLLIDSAVFLHMLQTACLQLFGDVNGSLNASEVMELIAFNDKDKIGFVKILRR